MSSNSRIGTHALPRFEGKRSSTHRREPLWRLRATAVAERLRGGFGSVETFVQFAGFPRSGHSLIGSILDAHPNALVSHELDAMGLVSAKFSESAIFALIRRNSAAFERNGRWWNGYAYAMEGGMGGRARTLRVVGDKKGDWAVRRTLNNPDLLVDLASLAPRRRLAWILVLRNPFDNIATMSLRKGRLYDRLRIEARAGQESFHDRLRSAQKEGRISGEALDEMVSDYTHLCHGVATLKAQTAPADWLELRHEELVADPEGEIQRLLDFLDLPNEVDFAARAGRMVSASANRSRHAVTWSKAARDRLDELIHRYDFLEGYCFDE